MAVDDKKRHRTEAQEWCFRLMNDPEQFVYEQTPTTNHFMRARIQSGMKKSKRDLAKTQAEYEMLKKYKARTAISK
jgi:glutamyl/glutaminyl-tRNA synthetase